MFSHSETYDIDCFGDVLLVLLQREPAGNGEESDDFVSESDTLLDDAVSIDTPTTGATPTLSSEAQHNIHGVQTRVTHRAVRFRVASERLRRSSPVFTELLNKYVGYPGAAYQSHYPIRIPLWNDDPAILALVLRMIHDDDSTNTAEQQFKVTQLFPETTEHRIDLPWLVRVAIVVDKYQLQSAVDHCLGEWTGKVWKYMRGSSIEEAVSWVWVTWVFELTDHFTLATEYLAKNCRQSLEGDDELEYPGPRELLAAIDCARTDALSDLYSLFIGLLNPLVQRGARRLQGGERQANRGDRDVITVQEACSVGLLLLEGSRLKFWPTKEADFAGTSYADAAKAIRTMGDPQNHSLATPNGSVGLGGLSGCRKQFMDLLDCLEGREWGLTMDDFKLRSSMPSFTY